MYVITHCPVLIINFLFSQVIGGSDGGRDLSSGERFNLLNNRWETIPDMNCQRSDCGLGIVGEQLYVFGGHDGNSALTRYCYHVL